MTLFNFRKNHSACSKLTLETADTDLFQCQKDKGYDRSASNNDSTTFLAFTLLLVLTR